MPTTIRFALPVALLLAVAAPARAESKPAADNYTWQVAATDATLISAAFAGFALEGKDASIDYLASNTLMAVGGIGYFVGAPIVHIAHGRYGRAGVSFAIRTGLPMALGAFAAQFKSCSPNEFFCGLDEFATGFAVGAVAAAVVDSTLIATTWSSKSTAEPEPPVAVAPRAPAHLSISPRLVATQDIAMLGVGGQF
jgi:hypothetical protein